MHLQNEPAAAQAGCAAVTSLIIHLRKGKNSCAAAVRKEWENERNSPADTKVRRRWDFPVACGEDHAETDFPLQPMEVHAQAGIYPLACSNARAFRWMYREGGCSLYRVYATAGCCQELWPVGKLHWNSSWRTVYCKKGYMLEQFLKNCICGRDPTLEQGRRMCRKKQQRRNVMKWPQPFFRVPLPCLWGGGGRRIWGELELGK